MNLGHNLDNNGGGSRLVWLLLLMKVLLGLLSLIRFGIQESHSWAPRNSRIAYGTGYDDHSSDFNLR